MPSHKGQISLHDKHYFKEEPKLLTKDNRFFIRWKYAYNPSGITSLLAETKIENDKLIIYIPYIVATSSGYTKEEISFQEIKKETDINLIKKQRVFWESENGQLDVMPVDTMSVEDYKLALESH